jgi:hypothetical protein
MNVARTRLKKKKILGNMENIGGNNLGPTKSPLDDLSYCEWYRSYVGTTVTTSKRICPESVNKFDEYD